MRLGGALDRYGICALKGLALSIYLPHRLRGSRDRHDQPDRYGFSTRPRGGPDVPENGRLNLKRRVSRRIFFFAKVVY